MEGNNLPLGVSICGYQKITDKVSVNLTCGLRDTDTGAVTATSEPETVHVGVKYAPDNNVSLGLEYFTGKRTQFNGTAARADRIIASAQFNL
ncbi:MAG: hypothetical protein KUG74_06680 [Rhodobacteraceae bacterium]|nr:hypothetical protein [Paracoccaceae bacterium]